ncbi:hypothetical protein LIER_03125 [Lithospermum erythrorhizon]|uniref:DUF642 domain-containing protein n=1 Tax=Lithospermum erythrorhizon TaxID=34254 RepID=A0AAV3NS20_LITER
MKRLNMLLCILLLSLFHVTLSLIDGLLPNGNFERGPKASDLKGTKVINPHAIPNWKLTGFVEYIRAGQKQGDMLLVVPEGDYAVRLGDEASLKTWVKVKTGSVYSLSFTAARTCAQEEKLNVSVSPSSQTHNWGVLPMQTMYGSNGWDTYAWGFIAKSDLVELVIHNPGREKDRACGPLIDSVALKTLNPPRFSTKNLLKNGNLEEGPYIFPKTSWGVLVPPHIEDDHSPLPGWMIESLKAVKYIDAEHHSVPQGQRAIELVAGRESALAQIVRTIPGKFYSLTFLIGDAKNSCEGSMVVEIAAGKDVLQVPYKSYGKGGFVKSQMKFKAVSSRTRIRFLSSFYHMKSDNSGAMCGPVVDDVRLVLIPSA